MSDEIKKILNSITTQVQQFAIETSTEIVPSIEKVQNSIASIQTKWGVLTSFHDNLRTFEQLLAWNQWDDRQTAGVFRYWTFGHDVRLSLTLKFLEKRFVESRLDERLDWRRLGVSVAFTKPTKVTFSSTIKDALKVTFEGDIRKNAVRESFSCILYLCIFPNQQNDKKIVLINSCKLILSKSNIFFR
jgi:hypothetical protein